jgi:hypothetical protein
MSTFATDRDVERPKPKREAWSAYAVALCDLTGREHELAEALAWRTLQQRLAELPR